MTEPGKLRLTSPADIAAALPYLLGFHPVDSIVGIGLRGTRVVTIARLDLPDPTDGDEMDAQFRAAAAAIARHGTDAVIVGYGPAGRAEPAIATLATLLDALSVPTHDSLRVADGRCYCLCGEPTCTADGVAYDPETSSVAAAAVYRGLSALPDRATLEQTVTPVTGAARGRMDAATETALLRLIEMADGRAPDDAALAEEIVQAGIAAVDEAYAAAASGATLTDDEVAWLSIMLVLTEIRDHACERCSSSDAHRRLWTDVTRRAMPEHSAAPACLLALSAYLGGDGILANIALDRALQVEPGYRLALLLSGIVQSGVPLPPRPDRTSD